MSNKKKPFTSIKPKESEVLKELKQTKEQLSVYGRIKQFFNKLNQV
jgi:hypothetical protein